ncbi:AT-rich interactive domain-containing protein 3A [Maylandia zebra]|uniref:AT-rich interactive domain-containing protein 3A n=1 Tax=Maylandia zebra TaxID=106582 RepID=UPI000F37543E
MVDNSRVTAKSVLQSCFSSGSSLPRQTPHSPYPGAQSHQLGSGGMKLEAVMENLQRQQAARLALEEKLRQAEKEKELRCMVESQIHQQALAFRHYQLAMPGALSAGAESSPPGVTPPHMEVRICAEDGNSNPGICVKDRDGEGDDTEEQDLMDQDEVGDDVGLNQSSLQEACVSQHLRVFAPHGHADSPSLHAASQNHEWTYEEQFKQLYELDDDEKRKEFLDDLFSFMQKRGTPVNRIPIMAKQVLDLYMLYKLVTEKGGLVEVINKKIWREITKGLNLPTSITSAAFTLRTQYMKYLYPYECEKRGLSSPGELQAAIDSNRREGRRQSYGSAILNCSLMGSQSLLSSPKIQMSHLPIPTHNSGQISQVPVIKKEEPMIASCLSRQVALPMTPSSRPAAAMAVQTAALEQLREKLDSGEPPQKKMMMEQQRIMQHALQQNLLAMASQLPLNIKLNNRDDRQETALNLSTNGISSINMSIEINGVVYTGVLFARQSPIAGMAGHHGKHHGCQTQGRSSPTKFQPSSSSSSSSSSLHGHRNTSP